MKRNVSHTVAFIGVMTALMAVVLTLETYVFIYFIKPSPAFLSIPLFIALSMYGDWKRSFIGGTIFGCCSFVLSFVVGYTVFYNPLISVLPRTIAGVAGYFILHGLMVLFKEWYTFSGSIFFITGSLNTRVPNSSGIFMVI